MLDPLSISFTNSRPAICIWPMLKIVVVFLGAATRVLAKIAITRLAKEKVGVVRYRGAFGGLDLRFSIRASAPARSASDHSATKPTTERSSSFMETTVRENLPPLPDALSSIDMRGNAFEP